MNWGEKTTNERTLAREYVGNHSVAFTSLRVGGNVGFISLNMDTTVMSRWRKDKQDRHDFLFSFIINHTRFRSKAEGIG